MRATSTTWARPRSFFLNINNQPIATATNSGYGIVSFQAPSGTHAFQIGGTSDQAGFAIDNVSYTTSAGSLSIESPSQNETFALNRDTHTKSPDVVFRASGPEASGQIKWVATLEYDTDTPRGLPRLVSTFSTNGASDKRLYYKSRGGRLRVEASKDAISACPLEYAYVVGDALSETEITARLTAVYAHGATPRLLTGIAARESTYRQFSLRTKYGRQALWPLESAEDGGSHIGLMQVYSSGAQGVANAWDWLENTSQAANLFDEKIRIARSLERRIIQAHRGLRKLTDIETENMALTLYGPSAKPRLDQQYYWVTQRADGTYDWIFNTADNAAGVAYADDVRARMR